jgi:hypothetical protein
VIELFGDKAMYLFRLPHDAIVQQQGFIFFQMMHLIANIPLSLKFILKSGWFLLIY